MGGAAIQRRNAVRDAIVACIARHAQHAATPQVEQLAPETGKRSDFATCTKRGTLHYDLVITHPLLPTPMQRHLAARQPGHAAAIAERHKRASHQSAQVIPLAIETMGQLGGVHPGHPAELHGHRC